MSFTAAKSTKFPTIFLHKVANKETNRKTDRQTDERPAKHNLLGEVIKYRGIRDRAMINTHEIYFPRKKCAK